MKKQLLTFLLLCIATITFAQPTAYWRGGSGNYNDPTKWSNVSGGAPNTFTASNGGSIPVSGDNIVFDNLSAPGAFTVTVPINSQCLGMLVTATCPTLNIGVNTGFILQIYGNTTVNTDNFQFINPGTVEFYDGIAGTQTINILYNPASARRNKFLTSVQFSAGDHVITNVFRCTRNVAVLTGNTSTTFNDSCLNFAVPPGGYTINSNSGVHNFNKHLSINNIFNINSTNTVNINTTTEIKSLNLGTANNVIINGASQVHRIGMVDFSQTTNLNANFSNAYLKMVSFSLSSSVTNTVSLTNSSLHFYQTLKSNFLTNPYFASGNIADVTMNSSRKPFMLTNKAISARSLHVFESDFIYYQATGASTDTYDSTLFYNGNVYLGIKTVNSFSVNSHLKLFPGVYWQAELEQSAATVSTASVGLASGASFVADASCTGSIRMREISLRFLSASPSYTCNGLVIDNSRNIGATLNAGSGSYQIPGTTTTGWTFGAPPVARTLIWTGTSTPTSFYQYKRWHQPSSWQNAVTLVTPECPPTIYDSIIFPNNSFVRVDEPNSVCHGMNWQGTGTLYDSTYAATGSTVTIPGHWAISPANTGVVMYNKTNRLEIYGTTTIGTPSNVNWWFNGRVYFKAWEPSRFLNSGHQVFRNSVIFDATSNTGGWYLTDSLYAHYTYEGQYGTGATIFANSPLINSAAYSLVHFNGFLNTNNYTIRATNYVKAVKTPEYNSKLTLGSSKVYIMGTVAPNINAAVANFCVERSNKFNVSSGTSEIIFKKHITVVGANPNPFFGGGYKYNNLTFKCNRGGIIVSRNLSGTIRAYTDTFNIITFENDANIYTDAATSGSFAVNVPPLTENMIAKQIHFNTISGATEIGNSWSAGVLSGYTRRPLRLMSDSIIYNRNASIDTTTITYNELSVMTPGMIYNLYYSKHYYPSSSIMRGLGLCSNPITLNKGIFYNNSGADYENPLIHLTNFNVGSTISSGTDSLVFNNSLETSPISGKAIVRGGGSRVLVWRDNVAGVSTGNWNDQSKWALATITSTVPSGNLPFTYTVGTTGQCVPSCVDTVIFDAASFDANDVVNLPDNYTGYFHTMRWATGLSVTPTFSVNMRKGSKLNICGSIYLQNNLTFNNNAYTLFTGNTVNDTIDALGKSVCNYVTRFESSGSNVNWTLKSNALFAPNSFTTVTQPASSDSVNLQLVRGHLNINGWLLQTANFHSNGVLNRKLSLPTVITGTVVNTSTLNIVGGTNNSISETPSFVGFGTPVVLAGRYQYYIDDGVTGTFTLNAAPNSLLLMQRLPSSTVSINFKTKYGNNLSYGRVIFNDAGTLVANGFCYNTTFESMQLNSLPTLSLTPNAHYFGSSVSTYTTNYYNHIKKLTSNNYSTTDAFNLYASGTLIDSIVCNGGVNIYDTTAIKNYYKFVPGATYKFPHNRVTYLYNTCDFKPIGLAAQSITLLSTLSGTKAWIRKDTGIVCADYCSATDNWAIGSGLSMPAFGTGGSFPGGNGIPIAACTATPGAWRCDTVLASSYYTGTNSGPTLNANPSQGFGKRGIFNGGANFTIGPNTYGWEKTPNPPTPQVAVVSPNVTLCEGDSVRITFTFIGTGPFQNFNYFYNTNVAGGYPIASQQTVTASSTIGIPSYTASPNYTLQPGVFPGDSIKPTDPSQPYNTFGTPSNPWIYSFWVYPTQSIKYNLGTIAVDRCFNSVSVTGTGSMVVTVNPAPKNLAANSLSNPICNNATAVITSTATQTGNTYYLYTAPTGTTGITLMNSSTTGTLTTGTYTTGALTTGTTATTYSYYVGAESQLGCPSLTRTPVTVTVNPTATVQIAATSLNPICFGQSSVISATTNAATGVQMYNAATGGSLLGTLSSNTISVSPAVGSYTYYLQANNSSTGCNATGTRPFVTLTVNPVPVMTSATNTTICSGNSLAFNLTSNVAGSTFEWLAVDNTNISGESVTTQSTSQITDALTNTTTVLQQVTYSVVPTGTAGACIGAAQTITVNINPTPQITSVNTTTICSGNAVSIPLTSNVASTYTWVAASNTNVAGESTSNQTITTINNTLSTAVGSAAEIVLYTVTPMSSAGNCLGTAQQVSVTVNSSPSVSAVSSSTAICSGNTATLTAAGANTYSWTSGPTSDTYTVNATGNYVVTGTDVNNCVNTTNVSLLVNPTPTVNVSASSGTICAGQTTTLTAATANSYAWSTSSTANTTTVMPMSTTVYTVTGTNTAGSCTATAQFTVNVNPKPDLALTNTTTVRCLGDANGTATVNTTSGTAGYNYTWTGSASTSSVATGLSAGTHTTIVTDARGCKDTLLVNIAAPSLSLSTSVATTTTGCSLSNGTATLTASGGWNPGYTYVWQANGSTTNTATGYAAGPYTVQVTDANGCVKVQNFTISNPSTPTISALASNPTICSGVSTTITPSGAVSYTITGGAVSSSTVGTSFTVNPTANTVYSIVGTDASNCISTTATVAINVNSTPTVAIVATNNTICNGQSTTLNLSGASTYTLLNTNSPITSGSVFTPTSTTTYSIQGSTGTCTSSSTQQIITVNALPVVTATTSSAAICSGNTATLTAAGANTYTWTSGPVSSTYTVNTTNNYVVTGTDINGCVNTASVSLTVNPLPTVTAVSSSTAICSGNTATLTAGGANTYTWTSGPTTANYAVTTAGVYTVTGTDGNNCVNTRTVSLTVNPLPAVTAVSSSTAICSGNTATLTAGGANTYTWTSGPTTANYAVTTAGVYTVTGTDVNNCVNTRTVSLTVNPLPAVTAVSSSTSICSGNTATLTAGGANTYTWTSGPTTANYAVTTAGIYTVTGTDGNNCVNTRTVSLTVNPLPVVTATVSSSAICAGNTATLTAGGANTYTWTNPSSTNTVITVNPSSTTNYVVIGTDGNNCVNTQTVTLNVNQLPAIAANSITNVSCFGLNNGSVNFTNTLGTPGYTVTGTNVSGTTASGLAPNNYTYTVTDAAGCVNTTTVSITEPAAALLSTAAETATNTSCTSPDGVATVTITGGTSGYTINPQSGSVVGNTITGLNTGVYTFTVTDSNGCTATNSVAIAGATGITSTLTAQSNVLCFGNNTGSVSVSGLNEASGTYNYTLTNTGTGLPVANNSTGIFTNLPAGTYSVNILGGVSNCVSSQNITITQPSSALSLTGVTANSVICNGGTALATATITGGTGPYTYVWASNTNTTTTNTTSSVTYTAGNYSVDITDANGCTLATQNFTVAEAPVLTIASVATTTTGCGLSNATATVNPNGGWSNYTYTITNSASAVVSNTNTVANLPAGTYTADVKDALGCATQTVFTITNPSTPTLSIASNVATICTGETATLTPTGAVSYSLNGTPFSSVTTETVNPLTPTVYNITGTDANSCTSAPLTVTVNVNALPTVSLSATSLAICAGQTATLTASGADTYVWSSSANTTGTEVVNPSSQTVYTAQGTNTLTGCSSNVAASYTVDVNALPTLAVASQTNVTCLGSTDGIATFTTNASSYTITPSAMGLSAGTHTFMVTDLVTTCTNTVLATITAPTASLAISSIATQTAACATANGSATITAVDGWGAPYTYSVNGTATTGSVVTGLQANNYTAQVSDALGCVNSLTFAIVNPNAPILSIASNTATICAGQSVTLTPNGASNYTLGTTTFTDNIVLNPTTNTVVTITGTDASSCTSAPLTVTVNVNTLPTISVAATSTAICSGNTSTLTASGADTYVWTSGPSTADYAVTAAGTYTVVGTSSVTGCTSTETMITVTVGATPTVTVASQTNVSCFGNANGAVVLSSSSTNTTVIEPTTNLSVGNYTFTIIDNTTTCSNTVVATIAGPTVALTASVVNTASNTSCTTPNGAFTVTASGGTPSYTYNTTNTTGIFTGQGTGTQNINIVDANGCTYTISATVPGANTPSIAATTQTNVLCNGGATGSASISVIGGTPNYTYTWSNNAGLNSNTQTNLIAGSYTVTATDAGACNVSQVIVITEPNAINAITSDVTVPCVGQSNGAITIEISGGSPSYNVSWNPTGNVSTSGNSSTINDISEGQYIATIADANGCSFQYPVQLVAADGLGCTLVIPEIFSPNGDGKNDTWEIKGLENYPNNNVTVFNRWGDQVFKAEPYKNDWDGTNTGDKSLLGKGALPAGTYYFILDLGNGDKPITGYVQLTK